MVRTAAQKIADVLIFLCGFLIFCDILLLPLTPALAYFRFQNPASMRFDHLLAVFAYDFDDGVGNLLEIILKEAWKSPETAVLALFLLLAGVCGAVILVQGIRLLASVADGAPFSPKNAVGVNVYFLPISIFAVAPHLRSGPAVIPTAGQLVCASCYPQFLRLSSLLRPLLPRLKEVSYFV